MKRVMQKFLLMMLCLGILVLLIPSNGAALPKVNLWDDGEVTVYGFLRNYTGMFTENPQPYSTSSNDLATEKTMLRTYFDFKINNNLRFWSAVQFSYDPTYPFEKGLTEVSPGIFEEAQTSRRYTGMRAGDPSKRDGKEYSEWNNINDTLRECYVEVKPTVNHSIRIGRQFTIWGESMTTRVGDMIHPDDLRGGFIFGMMEDSRIPQWMVRGVHQLPSLLSSFEWLVDWNLASKEYRVNRTSGVGQRFFPTPVLGISPLVIPVDSTTDYPGRTLDDLRYGFRTSTSVWDSLFGLMYFHTQAYSPVQEYGAIFPGPPFLPPFRAQTLRYPNTDTFGFYMNKQLSSMPGVFRIEAIYTPNKPFNKGDDFNPNNSFDRGWDRYNYAKWMIAYDLSSYLYFAWHKSASFDLTFEHVGEWVPGGNTLNEPKYIPAFNMHARTTWFYNLIGTDLTVSYSPYGSSGMLMPEISYMPGWMNRRFTFKLTYIDVFGKSPTKGLGVMQYKDMLMLTSQFDF